MNDVKSFHQANFQMNKKHYPATSKVFKVKLVTLFQHYGAKVHVNYIPVPNEEVGVQILIISEDWRHKLPKVHGSGAW